MKHWQTGILWLWLFLVAAPKTQGASSNREYFLRFRNLGMEAGLPANRVLDMVQDSSGYLWLATTNGLCRYNGVETLVYQNQPGDSLSLPHNFVSSLALGADDRLYVATGEGVVWLNRKENHFEPVLLQDAEGPIRKIALRGDTLFAESPSGILHIHQLTTGHTHNIYHKPPAQHYYSYHCLYTDSRGDLWLGGRMTGLYRLKKGTDLLEPMDLTTSDGTLREPDVTSVLVDSRDRVWLSSINGFYQMDADKKILTRKIAASTFCTTEGRGGILWIGSGYGLLHHNPETGETVSFRNHPSDPYSLADDQVNQVLIDRDSNLWVATNKGLSVLNRQNNYPYLLRHLPGVKNSLSHNHVQALAEEKDGSVWIGTMGGGLNRWHPDTGNMEVFGTQSAPGRRLASDRIKSLYHDADGSLWVGQWQGTGFNRLDPKSGKTEAHRINPHNTHSDWYNGFLRDSKNRFWLGIWGYTGMVHYQAERKSILPPNLSHTHQPYNQTITHLSASEKALWLTTNRRQIYRMETATGIFTHYAPSSAYNLLYAYPPLTNALEGDYPPPGGIFDLTTGPCTAILCDLGVLLCRQGKEEQPLELIPWTAPDPLQKGAKIAAGKQDHLFYVWNDQVLWLVNAQNKTITRTESETAIDSLGFEAGTSQEQLKQLQAKGLHAATVHSRLHDQNSGTTWLGTDKGLFWQGPDQTVKQEAAALGKRHIYALAQLQNALWLGTDTGLVQMRLGDRSLHYWNRPDSTRLSSHLVTFIKEDQQGSIWVGTSNAGLNRVNVATLKVEHFCPNDTSAAAFWGHEASCFLEGPEGQIWVGGKGLNTYVPETGSFQHLTQNEGLADDVLRALMLDKGGHLWLIHPRHLSYLDLQTQQVRTLTLSNLNLPPGSEFTSALAHTSGLLLFGTTAGVVVLDPQLFLQAPPQRSPLISTFKLTGTPYKHYLSNNDHLRLQYDQNFFSMVVSPMQYTGSAHKMEYRLQGIDEQWQTVPEAHEIFYTSIPPGNYTFELKQGQVRSTLHLTLVPPFWRTWWFYAGNALLGILILGAFMYQHTRRLRQANKSLEIEQRLLRTQMNPHFIFNALSAIQAFILNSKPLEATRFLSKFAKLIRLTLQNSREAYIPLQQELDALTFYLDLQQLRWNNKFDYQLEYGDIDLEHIGIPPMLIQPFAENAIQHGLTDAVNKGQIKVSIKQLSDKLQILIRDNGIGINASLVANNKQSAHQSLASIITRERLGALNKKVFRLIIEDCSDLEPGSNGTLVTLWTPYVHLKRVSHER